ncbi:chemotaxis protein CheC [Clostridia bacterium]|nr:chemotaxis protein CheC [Clostridia bacterium]
MTETAQSIAIKPKFEQGISPTEIIREVGNIGMGHAATALSSLLNTRVDMEIPRFRLFETGTAAEVLSRLDYGSFIVCLDVVGDVRGKIFHVMENEFAEKVVSIFFGGFTPEGVDMEEIVGSMLSEIGNITSGAYVNAISELTSMFVDITPPLRLDSISQTVLTFLSEQKDTEFSEKYITEVSDKLVFLDNCFRFDGADVRSYLIFLPCPNAIDDIIDRMRDNYKIKHVTIAR